MLNRQQIQQKAVHLSDSNKNILLEWCTGLGKTKATIDILLNKQQQQQKPLKVLILISEIAHKKNWLDEFEKWDTTKVLQPVIKCYASSKKVKNTTWDILVLDEGHHASTALKLDLFKHIVVKQNFIILSATISTVNIKSLQNIYGNITKYKITLKQAIEANILPKPKIFIVPLQLDAEKQTETVEINRRNINGNKFKPLVLRSSYNNRWHVYKQYEKTPRPIKIISSCSQAIKYKEITDSIDYFIKRMFKNAKDYPGYTTKLKNLGNNRKRFLGHCKTEYINLLIDNIKKDFRYICFCSSIAQTRVLHDNNVLHSKVLNKAQVIDDFNTGKINSLITVNMLQEGQNLNNINLGIIVQLDKNLRGFIQKFGRVLRASNPIQVIFYYENTIDEQYLQKAMKNIDSEYISKVTINNLTNEIFKYKEKHFK